jgi:putative DNA primase/helicase
MPTDIAVSFRAVIEAAGLRPDEIITDGALHRCPVEGKPHGDAGAYVLHPDSPASGWYRNWRTDNEARWSTKDFKSLSPQERQIVKTRIKADRLSRQAEIAKRHAEAREKALYVLSKASDCTAHSYLERKGARTCPGLKVGYEGRLIVPVLSPDDGEAMSLQFIPPNGQEKRFLTGGQVQGGFFPIMGQDGRLFVCEGLATGLSIHEATGQTVLCAFNAGNLEHVAAHARQKYPERELVICADDDRNTEGNPGVSKATAAALAVGAALAVPSFKDPAGHTDFNDLHQAEGLDVVRAQLAGAAPPKAPHSRAIAGAECFSVRDSGVYFLETDKDGNIEPHWVCSPLRILARTRNAEGQQWGYLLEIQDPEGTAHHWAMPASLMAGNGDAYRSELLKMGLRIAPGMKGRQRLDLYLSTARVEGFARCVDRIGWHGGAFVLPDAVFGDQAGEEIVPQGLLGENPFRQRGNLSEWQEHVARHCVGNSRLVLAVSVAFAVPLLEPLGAESGGFHFVGGSSLGKTTALHVAGSVCGGGPAGFFKQWRATDNGLEGVAAAHCDALLCLDEIGQAGSKVASEAAYMLANGQGKNRAGKEGLARKVLTWRVLFLSTGEITLADKLAEDGKGRVKAGQAVRVVDIPADAGEGLGLFETLHGSEGAGQFARQLKDATSRHYGTALRAFLHSLAADRDNLARQAQASIRTFEAINCPTDADGQVQRVCGRFALVAAAGELGIALGVLPWTAGEATRAAVVCFRAWLEQRGGIGAAEVAAGLEQVRRFFQAHGASRFEGQDGDEKRPVINRAGYTRKENGKTQFCVFSEVFRHEVCAGFNAKMICEELKRKGILLSEKGRNTRNVRTPEGQQKMFVLTSAVLGGNTGNNGNASENTGDNLFPAQSDTTGTAGMNPLNEETRSHCSHSPKTEREQTIPCNAGRVPVAPADPGAISPFSQLLSYPDRVTI